MRPTVFLIAIFATVASGSFASAEERAYPVLFGRVFQPANTYEISGKIQAKFDAKGTLNTVGEHSKATHEELDAEITGRIRNARLDAQGSLSQFTLDIHHLKSKGRDSIRPGTAVIIRFEEQDLDKTVVANRLRERAMFGRGEDGKPIPDNAKPLLAAFFPEGQRGVPGTGALGSATPRKVGDTWTVDSKLAAPFFSAERTILNPLNVSGNAKLEAVDPDDSLHLSGDLLAKDFGCPYDLHDILIENSKAAFHVAATLPPDPRQPATEFKEVCDATIHGATISSRIKMVATYHRERFMTVKSLAPTSPSAAR